MKLNFCSLSSGSSGNCYYIGNEFHGILVDAGISATSIRKHLKSIDVSLQSIMGVLVTHNHSDHIRGLEVLIRKNHIPVFTTKNIWKSLNSQCNITSDCTREIPLREKFHLSGFDIEAFPVSHDAPETIGFNLNYMGKTLTIATDLGHVCETSASYMRNANILIIESNYDEKMLAEGSYPYYLKKRIQSNNGHLGNDQTSDFLSRVISERLSCICLAHLSKNNNTPELALQSIRNRFIEKGLLLPPQIIVLNRNTPSQVITML
ncbi:MAG TPA: MBL fold metallo-hydrolase [Bacteroidales bacterium]|nr:MBL fold metallo-hydrolase [Bacteroidales bacterium]